MMLNFKLCYDEFKLNHVPSAFHGDVVSNHSRKRANLMGDFYLTIRESSFQKLISELKLF